MKGNLTVTICFVVLILVACQSVAPNPTSIPQITETTIPTLTLTTTPKPTKTPIPPTPTIEPPIALEKYLNGVVVNNLSTFDSMPRNVDYNNELVSVQDGKLQFKGQDWQGGVESQSRYEEGQGTVFDFMIDSSQSPSGFKFETFFDVGTWWTASYRRFGIYITPVPQANLWIGQRGSGKYLHGDLKLTTDVWYQIIVAIGKNADFLCVVWDPNNPDVIRSYRVPMGGEWSGLNWKFAINGSKGTILVDNLMSISFDSIK